MQAITGAELDRLYQPPSEMIQKAVMPRLIGFHEAYLAAATFFCLASGCEAGLDASPRGGPPGFVKVLDPEHVLFADWPGNNRIETLRNLVEDDRIGMLFLFPGLDVFLRINGRGQVTTEPDLLARLAERGRTPKAAILVRVEQVLFHCGKAINRAGLWKPESRLERGALPTPGQMLVAMANKPDAEASAIDADYEHRIRTELY